jgi:hypothetical protein
MGEPPSDSSAICWESYHDNHNLDIDPVPEPTRDIHHKAESRHACPLNRRHAPGEGLLWAAEVAY